VSGELIVFYMRLDGKVWRVRTADGRADDSDNLPLNDFRHSGIAYGHCIWVDLPGGGKRSLCGYHGGGNVGAGTYYSDDDWRTWDTSNLVRVPNTIPNIWQTGAVEPTFVQLEDGRIARCVSPALGSERFTTPPARCVHLAEGSEAPGRPPIDLREAGQVRVLRGSV